MTLLLTRHDSPVGVLTLVAQPNALTGIYFEAHKHGGAPASAKAGTAAVLDEARRQLDAYFAGRRTRFDVKIAPEGTAFQQLVWARLMKIPFAETVSYGWIAGQLGQPSASRAVGAAVGRNPLSILVPCHRVVGASGALTGFAGGVERKQWLLAHETAAAAGVRA